MTKPALTPLTLGLLLALALVGSGCLKVGPDYQRPRFAYEVPPAYDQAREVVPFKPAERWWQQFSDPQLNQVVAEALQRNLDLEAAAGRVLELGAAFVQSASQRWPTVNLQGSAQKQRTVGVAGLPIATGGEAETYNISLAASFEVDLWGKLARSEAAARAELLQAQENRRTVYQTVVANVITSYFKVRILQRRLVVNAQSIQAYQKSLRLVEGRYRRGLVSVLDLRQARRTLAQAQAERPSLQQELALAQQELAVLLGRYPRITPYPDPAIDYLARLQPVPPGLPSELLLRRPDLRAAEAGLKSLSEKVGVARAARFPSLSLTGSYGYSSSGLQTLFSPAHELWSLAMGLSQPVFNAGRLEAGEKAAQARYQQGVASYAKTVLGAFAEVEGALVTREEQQRRRQRLKEAVKEAAATQRTAEDRYARGLQDYLTVLEAQQTRYSLENQLVVTELAILTNRVTLHRALGGGWASPPPLAQAEN
ncbi:MAG: efflux transporter outer membrane subunit [Desulfarculus sp.]|nr:MAG: efflux transporter outer membrane subunit [Desulfarculus sp.]